MLQLVLSSIPLDQLRAFILSAAREADANPDRVPENLGDPLLARWLEILIEIFWGLALVLELPPIPDLLPGLGVPGNLLHAVTCQTGGCWEALCCNACLSHPELTNWPLVAGEGKAHSYAERYVLRALGRLPGIVKIELHPDLPGLALEPDVLVTSVTGRSVIVEVAGFVESDPYTDRNDHQRRYRARLPGKLRTYETYDQECRRLDRIAYGLPIIIWRDELAPRALSARLNEVLDRLGLPLRPPSQRLWFETQSEVGIEP